jgi:SRSO17 transposase
VVDLAGWVVGLDALVGLIAGRFSRVEPRRRVGAYLRGLLAGLERKNGWTLAEYAGAVSPDGMQRLLRTAEWDVDGVRDDLRGYVVEQLGASDGVWVVDETGFIKKGTRSAGVARQYTGTTGKIDNCQLGVFVAYASSRGRALVDRELYLPRVWTDDRDRCRDAGIPDDVGFATKPQLAIDMLSRAQAAGVLTGWVTADEVYGQHHGFRDWLATHRVPFVLTTRSDDTLPLLGGRRRLARSLATEIPPAAWERRSAGAGAHGLRLYDWASVALDSAGLPDGWGHWLLIRRQIHTTATIGQLAFYRCAGPATTTMAQLVRIAGARWAIEECFQTAKNEAGLDHYQIRNYTAWYRHVTLAMLATAYLAVTRYQETKKGQPPPAITT